MAVDKSFDSGPGKSSLDNNKASNSHDALMDYYDDVLGSLADDPLRKLEEAEHRKKQISGVPVPPESSIAKNAQVKGAIEPLSKVKVKPKAKVKAKASLPDFAEPEAKKISSLIIPAAFPKLAPSNELEQITTEKSVDPLVTESDAIKTKDKLGSDLIAETSVKDRSAVKVAKKSLAESVTNKVISKPKIDRATALKILEQKRPLLSDKQLERLEQKLGVKGKASLKTKTRNVAEEKIIADASTQTDSSTSLDVTSVVENAAENKAATRSASVVTEPSLKRTTSVSDGIKTKKIQSKQSALVNEKDAAKVSTKQGKPGWAQDRFECLIFTVAGLKLAVPLISLGAVYKIENELTPIPGRAKHIMGLYRYLDRNVRVVDTAQWVMPDRWNSNVRENYNFIIRLGGNDWGLACDAVHESIQLTSDQVKWRSERTKRAWLFGTVIGHMCALLDADMLGAMLENKASQNPGIFS